ncbi:glycosyltransferase family 4 protein [Rhodomicrobium sp. Az07]|uniref:glycosyltransferase family 4 protein n=1 Tax=Rhodomicrobium sp. Az07 TaxID=2839034 RepID=UPI001BEA2FEB|nr:glycosyltransferase family 4 protein [Rhodomicrobium sp. Az07]MBT3069362.1 glycosyltransferase family 4 protein [Rhodomicrobium sp. Az07]
MIVLLTQCFPPDIGGIETLMGQLARALHEAGEPVTVLADRIRGGAPEPAWPFEVKRFGGPRPWRRWRKSRALAAMKNPEIIADSWKSLEALPDGSRAAFVFAHGNEALRRDGKRGERLRVALERAHSVAANSRYTAGLLAGQHPDIQVVNLPVRRPGPTEEAARHGNHIVSVGRLEPRKGMDMVIRALPDLPQARYTVVGDGADRPRLESLASELGVQDRVVFTGAVDEVRRSALLSVADIFAMPARREAASVEGYGLVYLEAAWFSLPSIAGREGGAPDAVLDGETGLLVDGADAGAVRDALARLIDDAQLRAALGNAARERVETLTWEAVLPRYLALLRTAPAYVR